MRCLVVSYMKQCSACWDKRFSGFPKCGVRLVISYLSPLSQNRFACSSSSSSAHDARSLHPRCTNICRVAQNLLDMSEVGVLLVGEMHPSKPGRAKDRLALIGRARARIEAVDLNALFQRRAKRDYIV